MKSQITMIVRIIRKLHVGNVCVEGGQTTDLFVIERH